MLNEQGGNRAQPHAATDWLLACAMAVNEENAAGVVPAVLRCYRDHCIGAMRQTGQDMAEKYKETSIGSLAVNLPEC